MCSAVQPTARFCRRHLEPPKNKSGWLQAIRDEVEARQSARRSGGAHQALRDRLQQLRGEWNAELVRVNRLGCGCISLGQVVAACGSATGSGITCACGFEAESFMRLYPIISTCGARLPTQLCCMGNVCQAQTGKGWGPGATSWVVAAACGNCEQLSGLCAETVSKVQLCTRFESI